MCAEDQRRNSGQFVYTTWVSACAKQGAEQRSIAFQMKQDVNVRSDRGMASPSTIQKAETHLSQHRQSASMQFARHRSPWGSGSLVGLQGPKWSAGFFVAMTMVPFRSDLCGGHSQRCCWVPPLWEFLNWMGRNRRKFPTDCLYSPASKRRVGFWVENVAQDNCKPKKPHLFHGLSLYPQSQEIILLTEKAY